MNKKVYGYVRVSTKEQHTDRQMLALLASGVKEENIFVDIQSGKDFNRPAYGQLMVVLEPGSTVVIKSLDRLGRNYEEVLEEWRKITKVKLADIYIIDTPMLDTRRSKDLVGVLLSDLILAVFSCVAEMERSFNRQRQTEGIAAAKARGVKFGRQPLKRPENFDRIRMEWSAGQVSARQAAKQLGVTHRTFLKWARE